MRGKCGACKFLQPMYLLYLLFGVAVYVGNISLWSSVEGYPLVVLIVSVTYVFIESKKRRCLTDLDASS